MEKSKVYFCDLYSNSENRNMPNNVRKLFDKAGFNELIEENDQVAIKLHFGEKGNTTYLSPVAVRQVVDKVKDIGGKPFLTDTNTLYTGSRTNSVDHLTTAIENGFAYSVVNAPIIIADGLFSRNSIDVEINKKHFDTIKIAGEIYNSSSMIVMSHFKGHEMGGFGGTLKNLAMGCATAPGKQMQHSDVKPVVDKETCIGCTKCAKSCPTKAISMEGRKADIDHDVCYGCGECPTVCPVKAISVNWETDKDIFIEKMAEYAYGSVLEKKDKVGYITFVMNVTPLCDCVPWSGRPIAHDIGILASKDPIALDQACYDLVCKEMGHDVFKHAHPDVNATRIIDYGYEMGMGNKEYELINI
ncbi:DUF362 domain-containing protein [[Clostridium] dakarense]|uniref:DUF362 domain-containing protein n=1 Tax=Faecalimicrobium dakarense TaxID=1301100 RepID=UPI0004B617BD|nr:DUF362 domain-containing protein [[Clostridium] dakarense]